VILARSLGVPAVVGLGSATQLVAPGETVAVDGATGEVVVDPDEAAIGRWQQRAVVVEQAHQKLHELRAVPAATADGVRIRLDANLEIAEDTTRVEEVGAEGIGLYRSEFMLDRAPAIGTDEEMQVAVYRSLLERLAPRPVTVRTFDTGGERWESVGRGAGHRDRFGLRGVRTALQHDERFRIQIRALLRAAPAGTLRILLPFVTTAEEAAQVRRLIREIAREVPGAPDVPIGAMIEVPAAALTADELAAEMDFLSVGTNDLLQYTLAIDRTDEYLSGHYEPAQPAVWRLLRMVAAAGRRSGRDMSVCGEMAADPLWVTLLVGLGFRAFSMTPAAIPVVKRGLRAVSLREATLAARLALTSRSAAEVHDVVAPLAKAMSEI
jgi:phosphotransferase system enzyme I (PtsI)